MSGPALNVREARFHYARGPEVLRGVSLSLEHGESAALVGPNGSGKTTLLRLISRVLEPTSGEILVEGKAVRAYRRAELARRVAVVPQKAEFAFEYSVQEVVAMGRIPHQGVLGLETRADRAAVEVAIERAGIEPLRKRSVHELSGGELQLTLIARALAQECPILLLDEPTSSLDLGHQQQVLDLLRELRLQSCRTLLWVTHDLNLASSEVQRLILFHRGQVAADGVPSSVLTPERIEAVYGARVTIHASEASNASWIALQRTTLSSFSTD